LKARELATESLVNLVTRIASDGSEAALFEFHNHRTIFATSDEDQLLFIELLRKLADDAAHDGWRQNEIDSAVSLTTDRFARVASSDGGVDCKRTFRAIEAEMKKVKPADSVSEEVAVADIVSGFVRRHFRWALREARRTGTRTRFVWHVRGGEILLLMPETISGSARTKWLLEHVPNVDPARVGERERVQAVVDAHLSATPVPIDSIAVMDMAFEATGQVLDRITEDGLATCLAEEKARNVEDLRPSIRKLGPVGVRDLVHVIFDVVADEGVPGAEIAVKFGLDGAALSRFAGKPAPNRPLPDLWRNLARLLASNQRFHEICAAAGVWDIVRGIVSSSRTR
jgi:hypothetical protein